MKTTDTSLDEAMSQLPILRDALFKELDAADEADEIAAKLLDQPAPRDVVKA